MVFKHQTMTRTIHRLQSESLMCLAVLMRFLMILEHEKIFLIVFVVTTYLPQIDVKQVWSDHFLIPSLKVFMSHQVYKLIVNLGTVAQKKGTPWSKLIEKE
jgi:formate/nitrite transporter FocA (FNT family)